MRRAALGAQCDTVHDSKDGQEDRVGQEGRAGTKIPDTIHQDIKSSLKTEIKMSLTVYLQGRKLLFSQNLDEGSRGNYLYPSSQKPVFDAQT